MCRTHSPYALNELPAGMPLMAAAIPLTQNQHHIPAVLRTATATSPWLLSPPGCQMSVKDNPWYPGGKVLLPHSGHSPLGTCLAAGRGQNRKGNIGEDPSPNISSPQGFTVLRHMGQVVCLSSQDVMHFSQNTCLQANRTGCSAGSCTQPGKAAAAFDQPQHCSVKS